LHPFSQSQPLRTLLVALDSSYPMQTMRHPRPLPHFQSLSHRPLRPPSLTHHYYGHDDVLYVYWTLDQALNRNYSLIFLFSLSNCCWPTKSLFFPGSTAYSLGSGDCGILGRTLNLKRHRFSASDSFLRFPFFKDAYCRTPAGVEGFSNNDCPHSYMSNRSNREAERNSSYYRDQYHMCRHDE